MAQKTSKFAHIKIDTVPDPQSAIEADKEDKSEAVATPEMLINFFSDLDDIPSDNQYILNSIENIESITKSLYPLFLVVSDRSIHPEALLEIIDKYREGIVNSRNNVVTEGLLNLAKKQFLYSLKILVTRLNRLIIKSEMSINELGEAMADLISGKEYEVREEIPQNDIKGILDSISLIFPHIKLPKLTKKSKPRISNKAFKLSTIEPTPNHSICLDILSLLIKPQEFTSNSNKVEVHITHEKKRNKYLASTKLTIPKPETIDIGDKTFTVIKSFDWKDRKILRLLFTEALHHKGNSFPVSFKWILTQIGELRTGGKTLDEKLQDLRYRFFKYRAVSIQWQYRVGKKIEVDNISGGDMFILQTSDFYTRKNNKGYDIEAEIKLGSWFQVNREFILEFTRIPKKLLSLNTTYHWLSFAIGEKICSLLRINKEKAIKSAYRVPVNIGVKSLLEDVITSEEIKGCLTDLVKGTRLKSKILEEISYLEKEFKWQFELIGVKDNQSFSDFYNLASFKVLTDPELESEILGEKKIKPIKPKSASIPLTIEGDLVKALRKHLKMTQENFAKSLGYSRTLITKIERNTELASEEFIKTLYKKYSPEIEKISI